MGNIGKQALTPDTQLTFTCFLKKRFFTLGTGGSIISEDVGRSQGYFSIFQ